MRNALILLIALTQPLIAIAEADAGLFRRKKRRCCPPPVCCPAPACATTVVPYSFPMTDEYHCLLTANCDGIELINPENGSPYFDGKGSSTADAVIHAKNQMAAACNGTLSDYACVGCYHNVTGPQPCPDVEAIPYTQTVPVQGAKGATIVCTVQMRFGDGDCVTLPFEGANRCIAIQNGRHIACQLAAFKGGLCSFCVCRCVCKP